MIDPAKVTRTARQNSASVSALMLITEATICEIPEKKAAPMPGGGHGPEMDYLTVVSLSEQKPAGPPGSAGFFEISKKLPRAAEHGGLGE